MKKISLLVLVCMIFSLCFTSCSVLLAKDNTPEHTHSYATEWSFDATNHYNACSCGSQSNVAKHADENNDGACDVCAIILDNTHVFDTEWTTDATNHWHAALCGHDVVDAKAAHTADDLGICTVCGYLTVDITTVEQAIALGKVYQSSVVCGVVDYTYNSSDWGVSTNSATFEQNGTDYVHISENGVQTYVYLVGEEIYVIEDYGYGPVRTTYNVSVDMIGGYEFNTEFIASPDEFYLYGAIQLVEGLYALGEELDDVTTSVEDGVYSFSFAGFPNEDNYYIPYCIVTVDFTLSDDFTIDSLTVNSKVYNSFTYDDDWNVVDNLDITYKTDDNGDFVLDEMGEKIIVSVNGVRDDSVMSGEYTYEVTQYTNAADVDTPYDPDDTLITDYDLLIKGETEEDDVVVEANNKIELPLGETELYFTNIAPELADLALNIFEVSVYDENGEEATGVNVYVRGEYISFTANVAGTYELVVSAEAAEDMHVYITAVLPPVEYINAQYKSAGTLETYWDTIEFYTWADINETVSVNAGESFVFYVATNNEYCNNAVTVVVSDAEGNVVSADSYTVESINTTIGIPDYYYGYVEEVDCVANSISFASEGTYTVTITSVDNTACTDSFTVEVGAAEVSDAVNVNTLSGSGTTADPYVIVAGGSYIANVPAGENVYLTYAATAAGDVSLAFNADEDWYYQYGIYNFNLCNVGFNPSATQTVAVDDTLYLVVSTYSGAAGNITFDITLPGESSGGDTAEQSLMFEELDGAYTVSGIWDLTFDKDAGTIVVVDNNNGTISGNYTYSYDDGAMVILDSTGADASGLFQIIEYMDGTAYIQVSGVAMSMALSIA